MKFKLKNAQPFESEGIRGLSYNTKEEFPSASAAYIEVKGRKEKVRNIVSDKIFYVLEGEGEFMINGEIIPVKATDVVVVPKMTPYNYWGTMNLFLVNTPAFDPTTEEKLEGIKEGIKKIKVKLVSD